VAILSTADFREHLYLSTMFLTYREPGSSPPLRIDYHRLGPSRVDWNYMRAKVQERKESNYRCLGIGTLDKDDIPLAHARARADFLK
jgi:hypothetical protein